MDVYNPFGDDTETMLIIYAVCHMTGMSSACANPLLYGWLNDNFRKEFRQIGASICPCPAHNSPLPPAESNIPPTRPKQQPANPEQNCDAAAAITVVTVTSTSNKHNTETVVVTHDNPAPVSQVDSPV